MVLIRLESFEADPQAEPAEQQALLGEEARLQAYEQGYGAGWEDAETALAADQTRIRTDLARNLQALGFTYQEAREHVLRALAPLLQDIVCQILPRAAQEAIGGIVLETLHPLAEQLADSPVTVVVNPATRAAVEPVLARAALPFRISEEPTLAESQVYLRFAASETRVDLGRATDQIAGAVRGFFGLQEQEQP